jgi:TolB-like protein
MTTLYLKTDYVDDVAPVTGYTDAMILRSGTVLGYAEALILIGELYYSCQDEIDEANRERDRLWSESYSQNSYDQLANPRIEELDRSVKAKMDRALDLTIATKKAMENTRLRLDSEGFDEELDILEQYIRIIGEELEMEEAGVSRIVQDREIIPRVSDRPFTEHMANLFREMTLDLRTRSDGVVAVSGFTMNKGGEPPMIEILNETAALEFGRIDTLTLVERNRLDEVLAEQKVQLSGLVDTTTAIKIGEMLAAQYIVTGSVIEMARSVVIFGRVINVESAEVESVAQILVAKDVDVIKLLQ